MKKLTKQSLEELAKTMPVLSETEQRMYVGGDLMILTPQGIVVNPESEPKLMHMISGAAKINDKTNTYWYIYDPYNSNHPIVGSYVGAGNVKNNNSPYSGGGNMDYEGTAINKGTLRFLANNTEVEWMMAENISGSYGRLTTSNSKTGVGYDYEHIWEGYDAMYHSHPRRYGPDRAYLGPSDADREATGFFAKAGYSKCSIYEATTDEWVTYYGKKDSDEVYENEMTRPI